MIAVIILYALFALTFSAGKKALLYGSPLALALGRTMITAAVLLPLYFIRQPAARQLRARQFLVLLLYSLISLTSFIGANWALLHVTSIKVALFYAMTPLVTALISYLLHNETLNHYKIAGILIGMIGIVTITVSSADQTNFVLQLPGLPELALAIAVTAYATGWFIVRPLVTKNGYEPIYINGLASLISATICLALMFLTDDVFPTTAAFWLWTSLQAIFSSVICYSLYMYLLNYYSTNFLAFACFLEPIFAAFYGWILLGETPLAMFWVATLFVTTGLYLFYKGELSVQTK